MEQKLIETALNYGIAGLLIAAGAVVLWKVAGLLITAGGNLADKWAGAFLKAQQDQASAMQSQAAAMTTLATAVKEGQSEQKEVLLATRVIASKLDEMKGWMKQIDEDLREGVLQKAVR